MPVKINARFERSYVLIHSQILHLERRTGRPVPGCAPGIARRAPKCPPISGKCTIRSNPSSPSASPASFSASTSPSVTSKQAVAGQQREGVLSNTSHPAVIQPPCCSHRGAAVGRPAPEPAQYAHSSNTPRATILVELQQNQRRVFPHAPRKQKLVQLRGNFRQALP